MAGRRPKKLEEAKVAELALAGASNRDIGAILGCDDETVSAHFSPLLHKKRAERRMRLRIAQNALVDDGNVTMLIWLGKQELDQSDKSETKHLGKIPVHLTYDDLNDKPTTPASGANQDPSVGEAV